MHTSIIHYIIHIPTMVRRWEEAKALKQKSVMTKKAGKGEHGGQAQWNAGTQTSVSLVFVKLTSLIFFF